MLVSGLLLGDYHASRLCDTLLRPTYTPRAHWYAQHALVAAAADGHIPGSSTQARDLHPDTCSLHVLENAPGGTCSCRLGIRGTVVLPQVLLPAGVRRPCLLWDRRGSGCGGRGP